jgi:hypothetical protein
MPPSRTRRAPAVAGTDELSKPLDLGELTAGRHVVVHLGNVGYGDGRPDSRETPARKTREYAWRFPNTLFIGIDLREFRGHTRDNFIQIKANFPQGLKRLRDDSVDVISSDLGLGHYDPDGTDPADMEGLLGAMFYGWTRQNTADTLKVAHMKLRKGGKLLLAVGKDAAETLPKDLEVAGFAKGKVTVRNFMPNEHGRTYWTHEYNLKGPLYQVTAEK